MSFLGISWWKWLHSFTCVIFSIVALYVTYVAFIHYTPSHHRILLGMPTNYPDNVLALVHLFLSVSACVALAAGFVVTVRQRRTAGA